MWLAPECYNITSEIRNFKSKICKTSISNDCHIVRNYEYLSKIFRKKMKTDRSPKLHLLLYSKFHICYKNKILIRISGKEDR